MRFIIFLFALTPTLQSIAQDYSEFSKSVTVLESLASIQDETERIAKADHLWNAL
jgi:hypothetical protein